MKVSDEVGEGHLLLCVLKKIDIAFCLHPHSSSLPTINDAAERATRRFLFALLYFADSVRLKGCRRHNTNYHTVQHRNFDFDSARSGFYLLTWYVPSLSRYDIYVPCTKIVHSNIRSHGTVLHKIHKIDPKYHVDTLPTRLRVN